MNPSPLSNWVASHRRSLLFMVLLPVLAGIAAAFSLPVTLFPSVAFPCVRVSVDAGDRPAEQMVLQVTTPLEQALHSIPNVTDVRSTTSRGSAELSVTFDWGTDMIAATLQVEAAINQVRSQLPPGTVTMTRRMDPAVFPIIAYSLTSQTVPLTTVRDVALYQLRPLLTSVPGVAQIGVTGGSDEEYQILADPSRLQAYGLTFDDVVQAVASANVLRAVGRLEDHYKLYLVVSNNTLNGVDELRRATVKTSPDGGMITVADVATVMRTTAPQWTHITADGRDAILINVYQQAGGNSVQIARRIQTQLDAARSTLPPGIQIANWYDQSQLVTAAAASVRDAILIGAALASLVLLAFLRSWRVTVIAAVAVPATLSAIIMLLSALHMSFNIMTLGGMAAVVGLIIDDAIVMIEHIVTRLRHPDGSPGDVLGAAMDFTRPLLGSSAAPIVVFVPLAFLSGVTGAFFVALAVTMASGLIFSFLIAWLAVPLLAEWLLPTSASGPADDGRVSTWIKRRYGILVAQLLRRPALILIGVLPLLVVGVMAFRAVGSGVMPAMDEGGFIIDYFTPAGTALSETDRLLRQAEAILKATPDVDTWSRRTGAGLGGDLSAPNRGDYFVRLKSSGRCPIDVVMAGVRDKIIQQVPGLNVALAQLMEDLIGDLTAVPQPIEIKLFNDDATVLPSTARAVASKIGTIPGVVAVRDGINPAGDALDIRVDRTKAALEGIDPNEATRLLDIYLQGQIVTQIPTQVKQIGVRLWSPEAVRRTDRGVGELLLRAPDGHLVPLKRIARLVPISGQPEIGRENLQPMMAVTARIQGRDLGSTAADVQQGLGQAGVMPPKVRYELGGAYAQQQIAFNGLLKVFAAALIFVFVLLLILYERFAVAIAILLMPLAFAIISGLVVQLPLVLLVMPIIFTLLHRVGRIG